MNDITVFDVAAFILSDRGEMDTWKLQKLVYYCQAWYTTWNRKLLFDSSIEAWANGPVCVDLYQEYKGIFSADPSILLRKHPDATKFTQEDINQLRSVLDYYADKPGYCLRELTHLEEPWRIARSNTPDMEPCSNEITTESMVEYYGAL